MNLCPQGDATAVNVQINMHSDGQVRAMVEKGLPLGEDTQRENLSFCYFSLFFVILVFSLLQSTSNARDGLFPGL